MHQGRVVSDGRSQSCHTGVSDGVACEVAKVRVPRDNPGRVGITGNSPLSPRFLRDVHRDTARATFGMDAPVSLLSVQERRGPTHVMDNIQRARPTPTIDCEPLHDGVRFHRVTQDVTRVVAQVTRCQHRQ